MRPFEITASVCLGLTVALTGCYEEIDSAPAAYEDAGTETGGEAATTQPVDDGAPTQAYGNSRSTLGKARDSAESTIGDLEARDRELQKQIDDDRP